MNSSFKLQIYCASATLFKNTSYHPLNTGRKLNVHKTFRRRPGWLTSYIRSIYVLFPRGLKKLPSFHLISWGENFVETHSFLQSFGLCTLSPPSENIRKSYDFFMFSGSREKVHRPKLYENCAFPQNFQIGKLGEISVFYTVHWGLNILTSAVVTALCL